jgi:uncharacterized protein (TIGR03437 family)
VTSFFTTDAAVYLYFNATETLSDNLTSDWLAPDGTVMPGGTFHTNSGSSCYDTSLPIVNVPASRLGIWQARIYDNGAVQVTVPFTISAPGTGIGSDVITTVAGGGWRPFPTSSLPATKALLGTPRLPAVDAQGNLYVPDSFNNIVVRISPTGTLTLVAGNSNAGFSGDGGPATLASLNFPQDVAVDAAGNLYISDQNNQRIRKVSGGIITTVAGNGVAGFSGDGGPATSASLSSPGGIAVDAAGNLYIVASDRVREVSGGIINTVAGGGASPPSLGDGGPATSASLNGPRAVAVDAAGNLYIADADNERIRKVSGGIITTIAGTGVAGFSGDGGAAIAARINDPSSLAVDAAGHLFIADDGNARLREVSGGNITTVAGSGSSGFSGDGGPPLSATFDGLIGVAVDAAGNLFISDYFNGRIRKISGGTITTFAGTGGGTEFGDGGPATSAGLLNTVGVAIDPAGNLYISDLGNQVVRKVSKGTITTVAGDGVAGFSGDGGPATSASLHNPRGLAVDAAGNLYIADVGNDRIRKVSGGIITTVAGNGSGGFTGDGPATQEGLNPYSIAFDAAGNLYIADSDNNRIRRVSGGTMTTVAGKGGSGFSGDGGPATGASLASPDGIALDAAGNLYIADSGNNRIREVSGGTINTVAGSGVAGFSGDLGPALSAELNDPLAVAIDASGNLLIADYNNNCIRRVSGGTISTVAGSRAVGFSGDGELATRADFSSPSDVKLDGSGNLYIADTLNYRVREVLNSLPSYSAAPLSLTFSANAGGSLPPAQGISFSANVHGLGFMTSTSATWLRVTPSSGVMPTSLQVIADPTNLAAGTYPGTITISAPDAATPSTAIAVSFTVQPVTPPQLSVGSQNLRFTALQGSAAQNGQLQVSNAGGGSLPFTASASTATGGTWLSVSPASGAPTLSTPASLTVTANPGSLAAGTYQGAISITGAGTTVNVAVTLSISAPATAILLSQSGISFNAVAQGGSPLPETFGILNTGQGAMNWSATSSTLSGGSNWLQISPGSGTVTEPYLDVSTVTVSIDPTGLAAGAYYGQIQVSSSAANSPQLLTVILTVLPAGTTPGPEVQPTGLIFTGVAGVTPGYQDVLLGNPKAQPDNYLSASIGSAFSYLPGSSAVPPNQPTTLRVYPDFSNVQPGEIDHGVITLLFSDGTPRNISVLTVVAPSSSTTSSLKLGPQATGCSSTNLEIQWRSPLQNFAAVLGQPTTLQVQVVNDCGNPIGPGNVIGASVTGTLSNRDTDIKLTHIGNGVWTGTWKPVNSSSGQVIATVTAFNVSGSQIQSGQTSLTGSLSASTTPTVTAGGVVHAASAVAGVPIAPGSLITIYGSNLADAQGLASTLPLPQSQSGAQVFLGNLPLPILYTSSGQLNVQVPFSTPVNTNYQLSVQRDSLVSLPEQLVVAEANPGVFTVNEQGTGQGVIFKSDGVTLAQAGTPANQGETVVIYCTGLGPVSPPVPEGAPAPPSPLSNTVNAVTVTIGGQNAPVSFSGLTPGYPGLYQINAVVPNGVSGDEVPVVVMAAGQTSPPVTLAVQ